MARNCMRQRGGFAVVLSCGYMYLSVVMPVYVPGYDAKS